MCRCPDCVKKHAMSEHGFLECKVEDKAMHFNTEDLPYVGYCPFCGDEVA
jgi:hypothetical protein